jgi:hypothetical protein
MGWTLVRVLVGLFFATIGLVYVLRAEVLGTRSRRGTAIQLSPRGYRSLGALCLALAAAQVFMLVNGS